MTRSGGAAGARSLLIDEAAAALGVSRRTIYYRIRQGRLATIRTRGGSQRVLWSSLEGVDLQADCAPARPHEGDEH
jgi:excisionase family DNA binding protein